MQMGNERSEYEVLEETLKDVPITWIPALLAVLIERSVKEKVFHGFVQKAYKKGGLKNVQS